MDNKNFLISGYYGYKNSGDDALLASVVKDILEINPENKINILTKKDSTYDFKDTTYTDRFSFFKLIKAIKKTDVLIMGGGSLLQDKTSNRSLYYYLSLMFFANLFKKKVYLYANGIGPITKSLNIWLTKKILNKTYVMTLRDKDSFDFIKKIGVTKPEILVTADSVFSLEADFVVTKNVEKKVAFVIRNWDNAAKFSIELAKFADYLITEHHLEITFVPLKLNDDETIAERIIGLMQNTAEMIVLDNERALIEYFSTCYFTVCMRFHGLIYSSLASSIAIGLSYDKKVSSVCNSLNLAFLETEQITSDALISISNNIIKNYDTKKAELVKNTTQLKEKAKINKEILKKL